MKRAANDRHDTRRVEMNEWKNLDHRLPACRGASEREAEHISFEEPSFSAKQAGGERQRKARAKSSQKKSITNGVTTRKTN